MSRGRFTARLSVVATSVLLLAQAPLRGGEDVFTVTFDAGNHGRWSYFGNPANEIEVIEPAGGNPGAYLHSTCVGLACLDTFAPQPRTMLGSTSMFTGDYRDRGVVSLGIDLILHDVDFSAEDRPLTLMLRNDSGTPADEGDDIVVYFVGPEDIPVPGEGWKSFDFVVPSESVTLPVGWVLQQGTGAGADADWNTVITDVDQVIYFYGDPEFFFIFQQWEPGLDNPRIATAVPDSNAGDMNDDGVVNLDDVEPFVEVLLGHSVPPNIIPARADVDGDGDQDGRDVQPFVDCLVGGACP